MSRRKKPGPKRARGRPPISKAAKIRDREAKYERRKFLKEMGLIEIHCFVNAQQREWILASSREAVAMSELDAAEASQDQLTILLARRKLDLVISQLNKVKSNTERDFLRREAEREALKNRRVHMLAGVEHRRKEREAELANSPTPPSNIVIAPLDSPAPLPKQPNNQTASDIKRMLAASRPSHMI